MPIEVVVRSPMIDRKRIPMAKVRLRFENGTRMTIIDWEIAHGLILLLLGLFIRATTCGDWHVYRIGPKVYKILTIRHIKHMIQTKCYLLEHFAPNPKSLPTIIYISIILPRTKSWLQRKLRQESQMVIFQNQLFHLPHRNRW